MLLQTKARLRQRQKGFAEVIFCSGKSDEHLLNIFGRLYSEEGEVLGTRASEKQYNLINERETVLRETVQAKGAKRNEGQGLDD